MPATMHDVAAEADAVVPRPNHDVRHDGGRVEVVLPAVSWTAVRLSTQAQA